MFEEEDLVTAYWHPYLQLRAKLWDPPGEVKTETGDLAAAVGSGFGFDTRYFPRDDAETANCCTPCCRQMLPDTASMEALRTTRRSIPTGTR